MYSVLLVDDEPITKVGIRKLMATGTPGFELVGTASNGVEALRFVAETPVDIVITDLKMPQMDGIQLIHGLGEAGFGGAVLVLSNYSDFELVREALLAGAIDYMLKVNIDANVLAGQLGKAAAKLAEGERRRRSLEEHGRVVEEHRVLTRTNLLRDYLYAPPDQAAPPAPADVWSRADPPAALYLLDIVLSQQNPNKGSKKIPLNGIDELLRSIFEQTPPVVIPMQANEVLCLVPVYGGAVLREQLTARAGQVIRQVAMYYDLSATVLLPGPAAGLQEMHEKYQRCVAAHSLFFYGGHPDIIDPEALQPCPMPGEPGSSAVAQAMQELYGKPGALEDYLDELLLGCAAGPVRPDEVRRFFLRVLEKIQLAVHDGAEQAPLEDAAVLESETAAALKAAVLEALPRLLAQALPAAYGSYKKEVRDALLHIRFHYSEKLALEDIAGAVNLNASYLCRIFKKETGESLFQYINRLRMEQAARLMDEGESYVKEVAAQVGIEDQFYFTRLFRRHYGLSPTEYLNRTR